ncbi:MAG: glycosyltransferase family 4 protein [Acidimicrobiia bacterium]
MPSLLVTNDFPPKVGGIQSYLWELWSRLPGDQVAVLTTSHPGARPFDAAQAFPVERVDQRVLLPSRALARRVDAMARELGADLVFLDPLLPLGALGQWLRRAPYVVVLHGAEVTLPGRLPGSHSLVGGILRGAAGVLAAGGYPAREAVRAAGRPLPGLIVPPGVDVARFRPLAATERAAARARLGLEPECRLVVGVSRLVPRKGFDRLIDALALLAGDVQLLIGGEGRDRGRLERRAKRRGVSGRTRFLGAVPGPSLAELYGCADAFAMICRSRWGGLEEEGFGIVFLEAAACGVPVVVGHSGGAPEAVADRVTGLLVPPLEPQAIAEALAGLLESPAQRERMGREARTFALGFAYDALASRLRPLACGDLSVLAPVGAPTFE